mgnify:FL=1
MVLYFLGEQFLLGGVHLEQLLVAGNPDTVEEGCRKTVDGEDPLHLVAEIDEDEHSNWKMKL